MEEVLLVLVEDEASLPCSAWKREASEGGRALLPRPLSMVNRCAEAVGGLDASRGRKRKLWKALRL